MPNNLEGPRKRRPGLPAVPARDLATGEPTPPSDLERHRREIAKRVKFFLDQVDQRVARQIDPKNKSNIGNIREEIFQRRPMRHGNPIDITGINTLLLPFIHGTLFSYQHLRQRGLHGRYEIECNNGRFTPRVYQQTSDGYIDFSVLTGPTREETERVYIRRNYGGKERIVKTFVASGNGPAHPLTIQRDEFSQGLKQYEIKYDNIDPDGNVTLLDGQILPWGRYSAADHSITPLEKPALNQSAPTVVVDGDVLVVNGTHRVPLRTNIYDELRAITADVPGITQ